MRHLSVLVSDDLYKGLQLKAEKLGNLKLSDTLRVLLSEAVEKPQGNKQVTSKNKELQYIITTYYLMKEYVVSLAENGPKINNRAHETAEKIIANLKS